MGYWIVVAMTVLALAAVAIALIQEQPPPPPRRRAAVTGIPTWIAVDSSDPMPAVRGWARQLAAETQDEGSSSVLDTRSASPDGRVEAISEFAHGNRAHVVVLWLALDDVLAGTPLEDHERELHALLSTLGEGEITTIVGNLPDLARLPDAIGSGLPATELRLLTERWNGATARVTHHHRGQLVDLFDVFPPLEDGLQPPHLNAPPATADSYASEIAARFEPALRAALAAKRVSPAGSPVPGTV